MTSPAATPDSDAEAPRPEYKDAAALMLGLVAAIAAANLMPEQYRHLLEFRVFGSISLHVLVAEILMAVFFVRAAKEIRESFLQNGPLRKGGVGSIIMSTLGGVIVPAGLFLVLASAWQPKHAGFLSGGWIVATATDVALAMVVGTLLLRGYPAAVTFLVTLAIFDDAIGVGLIGLFLSEAKSLPMLLWVLLSVGFSVAAPFALRRLGVRGWGWYFLCGIPALIVFLIYHIPPAIAMVGIVCGMPHEEHDLGPYAKGEHHRTDSLNRMADHLAWPQTIILGSFAFVSTGIQFTAASFGIGALIVTLALSGGKFVGIWSFAWIANRLGLSLPAGMGMRQVPLVAGLAGIGFTVALLVVKLAGLPDAYSVGAMLTLPAGILIVLLVKSIQRR